MVPRSCLEAESRRFYESKWSTLRHDNSLHRPNAAYYHVVRIKFSYTVNISVVVVVVENKMV